MVPTQPDQVTIGELLSALETGVKFTGIFGGDKVCVCHLAVPDLRTASKMAEILFERRGENLLAIADIELPA